MPKHHGILRESDSLIYEWREIVFRIFELVSGTEFPEKLFLMRNESRRNRDILFEDYIESQKKCKNEYGYRWKFSRT